MPKRKDMTEANEDIHKSMVHVSDMAKERDLQCKISTDANGLNLGMTIQARDGLSIFVKWPVIVLQNDPLKLIVQSSDRERELVIYPSSMIREQLPNLLHTLTTHRRRAAIMAAAGFPAIPSPPYTAESILSHVIGQMAAAEGLTAEMDINQRLLITSPSTCCYAEAYQRTPADKPETIRFDVKTAPVLTTYGSVLDVTFMAYVKDTILPLCASGTRPTELDLARERLAQKLRELVIRPASASGRLHVHWKGYPSCVQISYHKKQDYRYDLTIVIDKDDHSQFQIWRGSMWIPMCSAEDVVHIPTANTRYLKTLFKNMDDRVRYAPYFDETGMPDPPPPPYRTPERVMTWLKKLIRYEFEGQNIDVIADDRTWRIQLAAAGEAGDRLHASVHMQTDPDESMLIVTVCREAVAKRAFDLANPMGLKQFFANIAELVVSRAGSHFRFQRLNVDSYKSDDESAGGDVSD